MSEFKVFMSKNMLKIGVLSWLALLVFVFSCESEAEKEKARVEREKEISKHSEKSRIYDIGLCINEVMKWDTIGYQLCCETNNACWSQVDSLGARLSFPVLRECGLDCLEKNTEKLIKFTEMLRNDENDSIAFEIFKEMRQNANKKRLKNTGNDSIAFEIFKGMRQNAKNH